MKLLGAFGELKAELPPITSVLEYAEPESKFTASNGQINKHCSSLLSKSFSLICGLETSTKGKYKIWKMKKITKIPFKRGSCSKQTSLNPFDRTGLAVPWRGLPVRWIKASFGVVKILSNGSPRGSGMESFPLGELGFFLRPSDMYSVCVRAIERYVIFQRSLNKRMKCSKHQPQSYNTIFKVDQLMNNPSTTLYL